MANKPKMEFKTNVPETVVIEKMFGEYTNDEHPDWGVSYGYELKHNGVAKSYFAKEAFHKLAKEYPTGSTVVICKAEEKNEGTGKTYTKWKMTAALFDEQGRTPQPPPPPIAEKNGLPTEDYRKNRKNAYFLALEDAFEVANTFRDTHSVTEPKFEDIRAIAVSMVIQFDRKS